MNRLGSLILFVILFWVAIHVGYYSTDMSEDAFEQLQLAVVLGTSAMVSSVILLAAFAFVVEIIDGLEDAEESVMASSSANVLTGFILVAFLFFPLLVEIMSLLALYKMTGTLLSISDSVATSIFLYLALWLPITLLIFDVVDLVENLGSTKGS